MFHKVYHLVLEFSEEYVTICNISNDCLAILKHIFLFLNNSEILRKTYQYSFYVLRYLQRMFNLVNLCLFSYAIVTVE